MELLVVSMNKLIYGYILNVCMSLVICGVLFHSTLDLWILTFAAWSRAFWAVAMTEKWTNPRPTASPSVEPDSVCLLYKQPSPAWSGECGPGTRFQTKTPSHTDPKQGYQSSPYQRPSRWKKSASPNSKRHQPWRETFCPGQRIKQQPVPGTGAHFGQRGGGIERAVAHHIHQLHQINLAFSNSNTHVFVYGIIRFCACALVVVVVCSDNSLINEGRCRWYRYCCCRWRPLSWQLLLLTTTLLLFHCWLCRVSFGH